MMSIITSREQPRLRDMTLASLDLNLLLVLDTVLAERSVARAARRLHVTPSAVSNALARLRAALDDPLISRSGRGIVPTPRAAALAPALARALRDLEQTVLGGRFDPATTERELTLAVADAGQVVKLPPIVARLAVEMPRVRLRVVSIDTLFSLGGLASTEIDVAIGVGEKGPGIHIRPLYEERTVLVARAGRSIDTRARRRLDKAALASLRHVDVHVAPGRGSKALAASYAALGVARDVAVVVPTFIAAAALVAATDYVASLPATLVELLAPRLGLRTLATPLPPVAITINVIWHERTHHDPAHRALRELIVRVAGSR
jgi:DNA-binding transcriptional LysR family regulator